MAMATAAFEGSVTLTPPEVAAQLRVDPEKVRGWIESGELIAVNVATSRSSRPRWRIAPSALADFERARSAQKPAPSTKPKKRQTGEVIQFFR